MGIAAVGEEQVDKEGQEGRRVEVEC